MPDRISAEWRLVSRQMAVCILSATTKGEKRTFRLAEGAVATFGRSSSCAFRVADAKVSRQHCLLSFRAGVLEVTDLDSANDLRYRGERKSRFELGVGDGFHAGRTYVSFDSLEDSEEPPGVEVVPAPVPEFEFEPPVGEDDDTDEPSGGSREPQWLTACAPLATKPHPGEPSVGELIGSYRIVSTIGRSDRCAVFLAEHVQLHRRVAIKWLRREGDAAEAARMFLADMRKSAAITNPMLLAVFDVEPDGDVCYAAVELADGRSLASVITEGPRLVQAEIMDLVAGILRALASIHVLRLVHGGVKPENVFLMNRGGARLADLRAEPRLRPSEWRACAAPELMNGGVASERSDLWSVGAVAFAAMTGGLSLHSADGQMLDPGVVLARDASLSSAFVRWLSKMLVEDPAQRPVSATDALDLLLAARSEDGGKAAPRARVAPSATMPRHAPVARAAPIVSQSRSAAPRRAPLSPAKVFFARLTGELIVFTIILVAGIALLLLLKIKFPDFDIYRLIERVKPQ
jgi:hypothetical protein